MSKIDNQSENKIPTNESDKILKKKEDFEENKNNHNQKTEKKEEASEKNMFQSYKPNTHRSNNQNKSNNNYSEEKTFYKKNFNQSNGGEETFKESITNMDELVNKAVFNLDEIKKKTLKELQEYIKTINLQSSNVGNKELLMCDTIRFLHKDYSLKITGVLEIIENNNYGFLRYEENSYLNSKYDIYVSPQLINKYGLREADEITGMISSKVNHLDKFFAIDKILEVSGIKPGESKSRDVFEYLTATYPDEQILMEEEGVASEKNNAMRLIDLITPCGHGQRMLIVAPPKTGKTTLEQQIAKRISGLKNVKLIVLLVDERPEEVTEMKKIVPNATVISSTFDQTPEKHIKVCEMVAERAKRIAESGKKAVIIIDSLTRFARACNNQMPSSGKVLSGGFDAAAIQKAKSFLGIARNLQEGGSITIIGTALKNTGSKGDDVVYEELKSTGNSEIELRRELAQKQIHPSISFSESSTREAHRMIKEESTVRKLKILWNLLNNMQSEEAILWLLNMIKSTPSNKVLFEQMNNMSTPMNNRK